MTLMEIPFDKFVAQSIDLWLNKWFILTAGNYEKGYYNAMTVAWGSIGVMWKKPFVQVVVRPSRHTYSFIEQYDTFSLCTFPEKFRKSLQRMGSTSGRDGEKISAAGLTIQASRNIAAPSFAEADLIFECRKTYWDDLEPAHFLNDGIEANYGGKDYHRIYFGEILTILGIDSYKML